MSLTSEMTRTFSVMATCDQCGSIHEWSGGQNPDTTDDPLPLGFEMAAARTGYHVERTMWFCQRECVHRWVDANIIDFAREPIFVHPNLGVAELNKAGPPPSAYAKT